MSDADRVGLRYVKEVTYAQVPSGPPAFTDLRFTSESLQHQVTTVNSDEIRNDRQTVGLTRTEISGGGSIDFEMSYGAHDEFLESGLLSASWSSPATITAGPSYTILSNVITRGTGSFIVNGFLVGRFIKMTGWDDAENNTIVRISAITATELTVVGATLTDQASGETDVVMVQGGYIQNGTTLNTYSIEREYTDLTAEFEILNGFAIDGVTLNVQAGQKITGSFNFVGSKGATATATASASPTAATTEEVMAATDDVLRITEGNATFGATQLNITLANNLRARLEIGTLGAVSIGTGKVDVGGSLNAYYGNAGADVFDKFVNFTSTDLSLVLEDQKSPTPNAYAFHMPGVKYTTGIRATPGGSQDVIIDLGIGAFRDPTLGWTIQIARFPGA